MFDRINPKRASKQNLQPERSPKTVDGILALLEPNVVRQLTPPQLQEVRRIVQIAIGKPASKIVDLNFAVDLLISRFYFRLLVGEDRRQKTRQQKLGTRIGNWIAAVGLIVILNVVVSVSVLVFAYLLKSAVGINLMPGHWRDWVVKLV